MLGFYIQQGKNTVKTFRLKTSFKTAYDIRSIQ